MRCGLRTLLILLAVGPPVVAVAWFNWPLAVPVALCWQFLEALLVVEMAAFGKE